MIVEIHGIDEERIRVIEQILISMSGYSRDDRFDKKILISAGMDTAELVDTHRNVFSHIYGRVFLREPGELCITLEGSSSWIANILKKFNIFTNGHAPIDFFNFS